MLKEEVIESDSHKVITVTEEGIDSTSSSNIPEVKQELTKNFKKMQNKLVPDGHHAMKIHEQMTHDDEGHV